MNNEARLVLRGRVIKAGSARGVALISPEPIGFLGGVDPETGVVVEPGHPLEGESVSGRVLAFPTGKGSTVGSYTLYRMARNAVIRGFDLDPAVVAWCVDMGVLLREKMLHFKYGVDVDARFSPPLRLPVRRRR